MASDTKHRIRLEVAARKAMLSAEERLDAARRVFDQLRSMAAFVMAERVLLYHSLPDELSTREFLAEAPGGKQYYLPRVNGLDLEILPYDRTRMHLGAFRIEEPDGCDTVSVDDIDLIVVPAVAFDRQGNRVGRGKGYYDRLLSHARHAITVGVGYGFQLYDSFEAEEHDIPLHFIIADGTTPFRGRR